ncbi:hypothetical protein E4M02_04260 [Brevundimonas sp. S30B]|uniref:capsid assembly protein n=1 Tax=unclassified Brevundimonas TaxID=2622653 RepID=UPI00107200E7|nr:MULTISPECIES: hypothetical protein [unclassified Brevundimonas]QBX36914.1 hypothetical protein E4M01_03555 [Brevundimonas sp. MF30-B]TFW04291.1 hypothetical protein E4M02_04260 [Brevundimonas sp. S30B]
MIPNEQVVDTKDYSELPASAFPEGVDPSTYLASLKGATPEEPKTSTKASTERPTHIPEKFWDAEGKTVRVDDLLKSYTELEGRLRAPKTEPEKVEGLSIPKPEAPAEGAANPLTTAFDAFASHYAETGGKVEADQVQALVNIGVPQGVIDNYLAGLEALQERQMQTAFSAAGGEEKLSAALSWAGQGGLSAAEIDSYDALVSNPKTAMQGVEWLMAKFNATAPSEGSFIEAEAGAATGDVFRNRAELHAAMKDDRYYNNDRAYRAGVEEKLARSKAAGFI